MLIAEIYESIQGEGLLTGQPSVFVRTSGCNLRCWFCDTPFTSWEPEGDDLSVEEITEQVLGWDCGHVVLTGGEPLLWAETLPLCRNLREAGRHITIETAGTLLLEPACDLMSISPKLSNSLPTRERAGAWRARHERSRWRPAVLRALLGRYEHQLKFVVDAPADLPEIESALAALAPVRPERVLLMPQGTTPEELGERSRWLAPYCRDHGYLFCPRKHIEWFGFRRGV